MAAFYSPSLSASRQPPIKEVEDEADLYDGYNDNEDEETFYGARSREGSTSQGLESSHGYEGFDYSGMYRGEGGPPSIPGSQFGRRSSASLRKTPPPLASSSGRPPPTSSLRTLTTAGGRSVVADPNQRPMTAVRAAGYTSQPRSAGRFDPMGLGSTGGAAPSLLKKAEASPEEQCRMLERKVNELLEEAAMASVKGDSVLALEKAKEASKKEKRLCKQREIGGFAEQINLELTYAVSFCLAHQYHMNKLYAEALNTYTQIVRNKQFAQAGRLRVNMGNVYFEQRKYPQAIKMYRMALDQIANSSKETRWRILRNIGHAFMRLGQYQDAAQSYEALMEAGVADHSAGFNLVICCYALGDVDKLKRRFQQLLAMRAAADAEAEEEHEPDALLQEDGLRDELRARQAAAARYISVAARLIAPVLGGERAIGDGYDWVVESLAAAQQAELVQELQMAKALQHLRRRQIPHAIALLKEFEKKEVGLKARAATNLSFVYFLEGDLAAAEKHAELAVRTDRYNAHALVNRANCLFFKNDLEGARAMYAEAVSCEADCIEALYNLGLTYKRLNVLPDALATFRKIHAMLPTNYEVIFQIGHIYDLMGNLRAAVKWLEILNSLVAHDPGVLARLGSLHSRLDDEAKALHFFAESHRVYPVDMDVVSWLGAYHVKGEVYEKAMPFFALASRLQPLEVKWHLMVASCFRRIGAYPLALAKYREIHRNHPENMECLRYLVHLCTDLGRKEEVEEYVVKLRKAERGGGGGAGGGTGGGGNGQHKQPGGQLAREGSHEGTAAASGAQADGGSGAGPNTGPLDIVQATVSLESALGSSSPIPQRGPSKMVRGGKKGHDDDDWGNEELGDDLLPM